MSNIFAPFEPEPEERRRRFRPVPFRTLLPNLVTLLALCLGLTAIRMAVEGQTDYAVYAIVLAAILDALDGRLARLLKGTSRFGAELDSLADFVSFGVAPAIVLYVWELSTLRSFGWIAVMVFAICAALRLARFNVMIDDPNRPAFASDFFIGMPAPAAAIVVLLPIYVQNLGLPRTAITAHIALVFALAIALLMVSRLPTWSGKKSGSRVPREFVLPLFVLIVLLTALLLSYPWEVLSLLTLLYLGSIPLAMMQYRRFEREAAGLPDGLSVEAQIEPVSEPPLKPTPPQPPQRPDRPIRH